LTKRVANILGAAVAARGVRSSIDVITDNAVQNYFITQFPLNSTYTSDFVDFVALGLPILTSTSSKITRMQILTTPMFL